MKLCGAFLCALVLVGGCKGASEGTTNDGGGGDDGGGGADGGGGGADGGGTDLLPAGCQNASMCGEGLVCSPATQLCVADLTCMSSTDCGGAAYCDGSGKCAPATTGSPCTGNTECNPDEMCVGGFCGCEGSTFDATLVPPNVLIVLDRSSSMNAAPNGQNVNAGNPSKWTIAKDAVASVSSTYATQIRFGLKLYPGEDLACNDGGRCDDTGFVPGHVFVDPGQADATAQISMTLMDADTCSFGTPTQEALAILESYTPLQDTTRANAILLITDGQSSCEDPVPEAAVLLGKSPSIRTFVVGFGGEVDATELNGLAENGGTAKATDPKYYQADDASGLGAALMMIAGSVRSCTYTLSQTPDDLTKLFVFFDKNMVSEDATNGWTYSATTNTVEFHGTSCMTLQNSAAKLTIVYGCPIPPLG